MQKLGRSRVGETVAVNATSAPTRKAARGGELGRQGEAHRRGGADRRDGHCRGAGVRLGPGRSCAVRMLSGNCRVRVEAGFPIRAIGASPQYVFDSVCGRKRPPRQKPDHRKSNNGHQHEREARQKGGKAPPCVLMNGRSCSLWI
jgi:hypothetical protein